MNKKLKTTLNTIVFLAIGIALFYWAISNVGLEKIITDIRSADTQWIILALVCGALSHFARALRWNLLLEPLGYKAKESSSFHAVIIGYLVNMAVPRLGEVTRPAVLSKLEGVPFNKLIGTVVMERIVDMLITVLIAISIVFLQFDLIADFLNDLLAEVSSTQLVIYGGILVVLLVMAILALVYRKKLYDLPIIARFKHFLEGIVEGLRSILQLKRTGLFIFYSLFIWLMYFMMPLLVFYSLEGTAHLGASAGLTVLLFGTAAMIIPVPGGIGTFHVLVPAALSLYAIPNAVGKTYAVLTHGLQVVIIVGIGLISVLTFIYKTRKKKRNGLE